MANFMILYLPLHELHERITPMKSSDLDRINEEIFPVDDAIDKNHEIC